MATATELPDLWGDDIKVDVVSPLVILKIQAEKLNQKTRGRLLAHVCSDFSTIRNDERDQGSIAHTLIVHAPIIDVTEAMLTVKHAVNEPYPATIKLPKSIDWFNGTNTPIQPCMNEKEFLELLRIALKSPPIRSSIDSMLARSNERRFMSELEAAEITPPST